MIHFPVGGKVKMKVYKRIISYGKMCSGVGVFSKEDKGLRGGERIE
jgi:hypothetical protein